MPRCTPRRTPPFSSLTLTHIQHTHSCHSQGAQMACKNASYIINNFVGLPFMWFWRDDALLVRLRKSCFTMIKFRVTFTFSHFKWGWDFDRLGHELPHVLGVFLATSTGQKGHFSIELTNDQSTLQIMWIRQAKFSCCSCGVSVKSFLGEAGKMAKWLPMLQWKIGLNHNSHLK